MIKYPESRNSPAVLSMTIFAASTLFAPSAALGQAQLPSAYAATILTNKPLAYWRLNESDDPSSGNLVATDSVTGKYNGTYGNAAQNAFNHIAGPQSPAFPGFESTNGALQTTAATDQSWVTAPQPSLNTNTATFTAWIHPDGDQADWSGLLMNRSGNGEGIDLGGDLGGGKNSHMNLGYVWNKNTTWNFVSGLAVPPDQWSFVAVVIEPSKATLYVGTGGSLTNAVNAIAHTVEAWGGTAAIGDDPGFSNGRVFNGAIDEVAVFNHALSFDSINTLYGVGLGKTKVAPPQFSVTPSSATVYATRTATFNSTVTGSSPILYEWRKGAVVLANGANISGATTNVLTISNASTNDAGAYSLIVSNPGGSVTNSFSLSILPAPVSATYAYAVFTNNAVSYWRLNESHASTNAMDLMGGLTGAYESAAAWGADFPSGAISGPISPAFPGFESTNSAVQTTGDGTNPSWVTVPTPFLDTNSATFTAWIYPVMAAEPDYAGIFMTRSGTQAGLDFNTTGQLGYIWNSNTTWAYQSGLVPPANQWSFVALVIDPSKAILYLGTGGALSNAVNAIGHTSELWGGSAQIGSDGSDLSRTFQGSIDEVAVFNSALSFDQINSLYGAGLGKVQVVAPAISVQPVSKTLYAGLTATFRAVVVGSSPLGYQWKKGTISLSNGGNISGATSDALSLQNITAADAGDYSLLVTGPGASITSSIATLKIAPLSSATSEAAVISAHPVAYWRLNETTDPSTGNVVANDYVGGFNGSYGTAAHDAFNNIAGPRPPAFPGFESTNGALQTTTATDQSWVTAPQPSLNTNTVTFTAWIHPDGDQADWSGLLMNRSGNGEGIDLGGDLGGGKNSHMNLGYIWNNNTTWNFVSGLAVPPDQWSFVAVVIESAKATLYVGTSGSLTNAVNPIPQTAEAWGGTAAIGDDPGFGNGRVFNGSVDEVAVFAYALTAQQIEDLFAGVSSPGQPKLTISTVSAGKITLSWDGSGKLESTTALGSNPTIWNDEGSTSPVTVIPSGTAKFYRVQAQ
jgi:hypothetical protein